MIKSAPKTDLRPSPLQQPLRPQGGRVDLIKGDPVDDHLINLRNLGAVLVTMTPWPPEKPLKRVDIISASVPRPSAETVRDLFAQHMPNVPSLVREVRVSADVDGFDRPAPAKPSALPVYPGASASDALNQFGPMLMALGASDVSVAAADSKQVIQVVVSNASARRRVADYLADNLPRIGAVVRVSARK